MPQSIPSIIDPPSLYRAWRDGRRIEEANCQRLANDRIETLLGRIENLPLFEQLQSLRAYQREHGMGESLWERANDGRRGQILLFDGQARNEPMEDAVTRKIANIRRTETERCRP